MIDEGYIKYSSHWTKGPVLDDPLIDELIRWRRPLFDKGLVGQYEDLGIGYGNLSARSGQHQRFYISGTQTGHLPDLTPAHFSLVTDCDATINRVTSTGPAEPSSEAMTHAALYQIDPEIRAVVHVHSEHLWLRLKDALPTTAAGIAYGTPEMAQAFDRLYRETVFGNEGIAVMAGHEGGLISTGRSLEEATERILSVNEEFAGQGPRLYSGPPA